MQVSKLVRILETDGWTYSRTKGSHRIFVHPDSKRPVVISEHSKKIDGKRAKMIIEQAKNAVGK